MVGIIYAVLRWREQLLASWERVRGSWCDGDDGRFDGNTVNENTSLLYSPRDATAGVGRSWSYWVYNTTPGDGDRGESRPGVERSDTSGEESEAVGGREFEERRRRMLERSVNGV